MTTTTDSGVEQMGSELDRLAALLGEEDEDLDEAADSQAEDRDDGAEEGADAEDESEDDDDKDELVTIKVDGKERQVSRAELIELAQKSDSATQRFQEAAAVRQQAEQVQQQASQARDQAMQLAQQYQEQLGSQLAQFQQVDWQQLLNEDPQQYLQVKHAYDALQQQMYAVAQHRQQLAQETAHEQQRVASETLQRESQALLQALPEWRDPKVATAEQGEIKEWMLKRGYSQAEISNVTDHRRLLELRDAMLLSKLRDKKPLLDKKVKDLPKPPAKSGGRQAPQGKNDRAASDKLRKTGRVNDAVGALTKFL